MHYDAPKWKRLIQKRLQDPDIKSLREEIAILREVLSRILEQCDPESNDVILMHAPISDLVSKIERLVTSCHKLETSMKFLLDPTTLDAFISEVIVILTQTLKPQQLAKVAAEIVKCKATM